MVEMIKNFIAKPHYPSRRSGRKPVGQGMVEFALALPVLLMVVYGLLEAGRLIFIYASTLTAARQAARYGSASGLSDAGVPYYRDCDGIRNEVDRVGFINTFDTIAITYDGGLDDEGDIIVIPGINSNPAVDTCGIITDDKLNNGDRIKVLVTAIWEPIIAIVPSWQGFTITSAAERTLLMEIALGVDPVGKSWEPGAVLELKVTGSPATFNAVGQTLTFQYTLKNIGVIPLTNFTVSDHPSVSACSGLPASLALGASASCTVTYSTTQADLDAGGFTNIVSANSTEALSDTLSVTISAVQLPKLTLTKTASPTVALSEGIEITYTYKLTNSGNVTLTSPYSVTDDKVASGQIDCSGAAASIAPGAFTQCTGPYSITASDILAGSVTNTATATATFNTTTVTSNSANAAVSTSALDLTISPSPGTVSTLNQKITYTYTLRNLSVASLSNPYSVTDSRATNLDCPSSSSLAPAGSPGDTTTCTGEYYVTQADLDAGVDLTNNATASSNAGIVTSNSASAAVQISQGPALSLTVTPSTNIATTLGDNIDYTYTITNSGNVTLSAPFTVTDLGVIGSPTCTVTTGTLDPSTSTTCVMSYTVVQADLDAGSIINLASVTTTFNGNPVNSTQATATVITYNAPRVTLSISSVPSSFPNLGTPLSIKFTLRNTGNVALTSPYAVSASAFLGAVSCSSAVSPLAIGASTDCTASYTTTQTDINNGVINISATATANNGALTSNTATLTIYTVLQCYVYHDQATDLGPSVYFTGSGINKKMHMEVISASATTATITIKTIEIRNWNYSSHSEQFISNIYFGGVLIWTGANTQRLNPLILPIPSSAPWLGSVSLAPGATKVLDFEFNKNYTETGTEIIKVTFAESGCPVLNSSDPNQVQP